MSIDSGVICRLENSCGTSAQPLSRPREGCALFFALDVFNAVSDEQIGFCTGDIYRSGTNLDKVSRCSKQHIFGI